jgi:hypothetical protein
MPTKIVSAFTKKNRRNGSAKYIGQQDKLSELSMLYSKGNGYEDRYDFPVTVTKIEDKQ